MAIGVNQREFKIEARILKQVLHFHIEEDEEIVGASYQVVGGLDGPHRVVLLLEKSDGQAQG